MNEKLHALIDKKERNDRNFWYFELEIENIATKMKTIIHKFCCYVQQSRRHTQIFREKIIFILHTHESAKNERENNVTKRLKCQRIITKFNSFTL